MTLISSWASYSILDSLSFSYRLIYEIKEGINGIDSDLIQNISPATNPHSTKEKIYLNHLVLTLSIILTF